MVRPEDGFDRFYSLVSPKRLAMRTNVETARAMTNLAIGMWQRAADHPDTSPAQLERLAKSASTAMLAHRSQASAHTADDQVDSVVRSKSFLKRAVVGIASLGALAGFVLRPASPSDATPRCATSATPTPRTALPKPDRARATEAIPLATSCTAVRSRPSRMFAWRIHLAYRPSHAVFHPVSATRSHRLRGPHGEQLRRDRLYGRAHVPGWSRTAFDPVTA